MRYSYASKSFRPWLKKLNECHKIRKQHLSETDRCKSLKISEIYTGQFL